MAGEVSPVETSVGIWWAAAGPGVEGGLRVDGNGEYVGAQWRGGPARAKAAEARDQGVPLACLIRWRRDHEKTWHDEPCTEDVESLEAWLADDYTYLPF
jgi:hypothetical protein